MKDFVRRLIWLLPIGVVIAGCGSAPELEADSTVALDPPAAVAPAVVASTEPESTPVTTPAPELADPQVATAQVAEYTPPFPDRLEPFDPPKRAQGTQRKDEENGASVELKGFINVDEPRVLLSIDGVIAPIPEGGEKYGVRVHSIQPPSVILERGRNRWKATLE